ncbi:MAG: hypothetical protein KDC34_16155 [Saprospiraceae bacterium]|nr:hypothetical protein [Saprospiraceae bacterium]
MNRIFTLFLLTLLLVLPFQGKTQMFAPGTPYYLTLDPGARPKLSQNLFDPPGTARIERAKSDFPDLFAIPEQVNWNMQNQGQWLELDNGDRIWWLNVHIPNAAGLAACYQNFYLPPGARLFMFSPSGEEVLGSYTNANNKKSGMFRTGFITGDSFILEYYEPAAFRGKGSFDIFRLDYAFDGQSLHGMHFPPFGFGTSDPCNININCPEGANWQDEKQGVCRIQMTLVEGTGWCSGSLLNNVLEDGTPYVLSGYHCQDGYTPLYDLWRFDFNYEGPDCANPPAEPVFNSVIGCQQRAGYQASDFLLVELLSAVPLDYNVYFNGWNREDAAPPSSAHIHHPNADIKKISLDTQAAIIHPLAIDWNNGVTTPANHHLRVKFDLGTFEPGSSGGPLFDNTGKVVGQLHGGIPGCTQVTTYHGRFFMSWEGGGTPSSRLKDWLDPNDDGPTMIDGIYDPSQGLTANISGRIHTESGQGIIGVSVILSGFVQDTVLTDTSGMYVFPNLPIDQSYVIRPEKDTGIGNGVTTYDMVTILKHILGVELLNSPIKHISADANHSNNVSTLDMVSIQKVILSLSDTFPNNTSWRFVDSGYIFGDPPLANFPEEISIELLTTPLSELDFIGTKIGDVNVSANPYLY